MNMKIHQNRSGRVLMALKCVIACWAVCGYSGTIEVEYNGPGSETEASQEPRQDEADQEDSGWDQETAEVFDIEHASYP